MNIDLNNNFIIYNFYNHVYIKIPYSYSVVKQWSPLSLHVNIILLILIY